MTVTLHDLSDLAELERLVAQENNAKQRDRYRAVLLALDGKQTRQIVGMVARSRKFVQEWVYRYRDGGREALLPIK